MTQLVFAGVGAALGSLAGPMGAQIGWALGSAIGGYAAQPDQTGPRLDDLSVSVSSYGQPVPSIYGGTRITCPVIWAADLIETKSTQSAKGGPELTTFSYSASFACAVGEGVIPGIRKIWLDTKLAYDASAEPTNAEAQAVNAAISDKFVFYTGSEAQLPDPTIESYEDDVEAYRGTAYIVFTNLPLADFGNRIPQVRVETTTDTPAVTEVNDRQPYSVGAWSRTGEGDSPIHATGDTLFDVLTIPVFSGGSSTVTLNTTDWATAIAAVRTAMGPRYGLMTYNGSAIWTTSANGLPNVFEGGANVTTDDPEYVYLLVSYADEPVRFIYENTYPGTGGTTQYSLPFEDNGAIVETPSLYSEAASAALLRESFMQIPYGVEVVAHDGSGVCRIVFSTAEVSGPSGYTTIAHAVGYPSNYPPPSGFPSIVTSQIGLIRCKRVAAFPTQTCQVGTPETLGIAQFPGNSAVCISSTGALSTNYVYEEEAGTFKQLQQVTYAYGELIENGLGPVLLPSDPNYSSEAYWTAQATVAGVTGTYGVDYPRTVTAVGLGTATVTEADEGSVLLSAIVTNVCQRAGLTSGQLDVAQLTDSVPGYRITRPMQARGALEPLRRAYYFDAVESGDKIKFVKRGGAVAATITLDDLGASLGEPGEPVESTRAQETELPSRVVVAYDARSADYQIGTQQASRQVGESQQLLQIEVPITLTENKAAQIADVLLYEAHVGKVKRTLQLPPKFVALEPTDIITVTEGTFTHRLRILDEQAEAGVKKLDCVADDPEVYSPNSVGASVGSQSSLRLDAPSLLVALDLPLLQDADDALPYGYYLAGRGYASGWRGMRAFYSVDAGVSYTAAADVVNDAVVGQADTVLATWAGGNMFDEASSVDVTLVGSATLASATKTQLLSNSNAAALGSEVIQFTTATLLSAGKYRLSGFLRGRLGTEWAMSTHARGERFVLLETGAIQRAAGSLALINAAQILKGVTYGLTIDNAFEVPFTNTANGSRPLSPVHLAAAPVGGSPLEYRVQWVRRTRVGGAWVDNIDAALGETSEQYSVVVARAGVTISTTSTTTTSAQIVGQSGDTVTVYQVSGSLGALGRGATITLG